MWKLDHKADAAAAANSLQLCPTLCNPIDGSPPGSTVPGVLQERTLKNWCFWTVVLKKTFESPVDWKAITLVNPKGNQLWIFIGRTDLKLKPQYLWLPKWKVNSSEKTLVLGRIEGRMRRGQQRTKWLDGIIESMDMSLSKLWEVVKDSEAWCATVHGVTKNRTQLINWTIITTTPRRITSWTAFVSGNVFKNAKGSILFFCNSKTWK